jgi:hypothetical protein
VLLLKSYVLFRRIYAHQNRGLAFTNPERLLESLDDELMAYLHYSLEEVLAHEGFSQRFIEELAMGILRNNYGQTPSAQAFVGRLFNYKYYISVNMYFLYYCE